MNVFFTIIRRDNERDSHFPLENIQINSVETSRKYLVDSLCSALIDVWEKVVTIE